MNTILAKAAAAADPRQADTFVIPTDLQLVGTVMLQRAVRRQYRANPPLSRREYPGPLNPPADPFPYYVDAAIVRGIRALVRRSGPFVR